MSSSDRNRHVINEGEKEIAERLDEALFSLEMLVTPETLGRTINEALDWHSENSSTETEGILDATTNLAGSVNFGLDCIASAIMTEIFMVSGSLTRGIHKASRYLDENGMFHHVGTDMTRLAGLKIKPALQQIKAFPFVVANRTAGVLHIPFAADASLFVRVDDAFVTKIGTLCGSSGAVFPRSSVAAFPVCETLARKTYRANSFYLDFIVARDETFCVACTRTLSQIDPRVIGVSVEENKLCWA